MQRLLAVLALATGCTDEPVDRRHAVEAPKGDDYNPPDCPQDECGLNTGSMGDKYWHDLNLDHLPNASGVRYQGIIKPPPAPPAAVGIGVSADNRLMLVDANGDEVTGADIVGTRIILGLDGLTYVLKVLAKHNTAGYWAYNAGTFWTYTLGYKLITDPPGDHNFTPLCKIAAEGVDGSVASDVVVFTGERYDAATKKITVTTGGRWINVACLGSGPAKQFLTRHTIASQDPAHPTTAAERQAMLNAWTGNYCNDGRSFTHTGEPIRFRDDRGFFPEDSDWSWSVEFNELGPINDRIRSYDAVWGEDGAICIDTPRLRYSLFGDDPTIRDDIGDWCESVGRPRPPRCTSPNLKGLVLELEDWDTNEAHILSANPPKS